MTIDFCEGWEFRNNEGVVSSVSLPHDAMLREKRTPNCHNGVNTGYFPGGKYQYEKTFRVSEGDAKKDIRILFEAVYRNATVLLNGEKLLFHAYGYTEFEINLTGKVNQGENTITVLVDNSLEPNSRWYSGSGIIRPVSLIIRERICPTVLTVQTKKIVPTIIQVTADVGADITICKKNGETVNYRVIHSEEQNDTVIYSIEIENGELWSAETPSLYICKSKLGNEELVTTFGIRLLSWDAKSGLCVNGKRVLLRGGCIHHDNGVLGACGFTDAEWRRVRILKEAGYNALRIAHNPASRAMLDACDYYGMYVMDEAFDGWYIPKTHHDYSRDFYDNWKSDIKAMVVKDINHPSVIMYSIGNEVTETASDKGVKLAGEMSDYVNMLDPTRPTTAGINVLLNVYIRKGIGIYKDKGEYVREPLPPKTKGYKEKKSGSAFFNAMAGKIGGLMFFMSSGKKGEQASAPVGEKLNVLGLNYAASRFEADVKKYPERLMVASETMVTDLPYNWKYIKKYPQILGDFVWAAWDYLGEAAIGDYTYQSYPGLPLLAGSGTIDITGNITAEAYFQQIVWELRDKPYIGVTPLNHNGETPNKSAWRFTNAIDSWNWPGYEKQKASVEVYAKGKYVRLELNGRVLGCKPLKEFRTKFSVPYEPGVLKAYALDENKKVLSEHFLQSGIGGLKIKATTEYGHNKELVFIRLEFVDNEDILRSDVERLISVDIPNSYRQSIQLLGMGSALAKTNESYLNNSFHSYRGAVFLVVKCLKDFNGAEIKVSAEGVNATTIQLAKI